MKNILFSFVLVFLSVSLMNCKPINYSQNHFASAEGEDNSFPPNEMISGKTHFIDTFITDKVDLVFVLDNQKGMEEFYKNNIFDEGFLQSFKEYDWRVAYTDTSINDEFLKQKEQSKKTSQPKNDECEGFLGNLLLGALGVVTSTPYIFLMSAQSTARCVTSAGSSSSSKKITSKTNGTFLPFEYNNKKVELGVPYLTSSQENHNAIFDHTMSLGKRKKHYSQSYDAPVVRKKDEPSYPLISSVLSIGKYLHQSDGFFRKDSLIVMVIVTASDMKISPKAEEFKKSISSAFGKTERFKMLPVSIQSNDSLCKLQFNQMGVSNASPAKQLNRLSESLGGESISICSSQLGEELSSKIQENLSSLEL